MSYGAAIIFAGTHVSLTILYSAWMICKVIVEAQKLADANSKKDSP